MVHPLPIFALRVVFPLSLSPSQASLGPDYLEDQLAGGPLQGRHAPHCAHAEQTKVAEREMALACYFEESPRPSTAAQSAFGGRKGGWREAAHTEQGAASTSSASALVVFARKPVWC